MAYFPFMMIMTFPILDKSSGIGKGIYSFTATMVLLNSACNPVFYVWRFSEPRYHVKRWFCFWNKRMREKIDRLHNQQYASYDIYTISTSVQLICLLDDPFQIFLAHRDVTSCRRSSCTTNSDLQWKFSAYGRRSEASLTYQHLSVSWGLWFKVIDGRLLLWYGF